MPESKTQQVVHSNEEITNFLICGDARGPKWLAAHPEDRKRAVGRLLGRGSLEHGFIRQAPIGSEAQRQTRPEGYPA